jgi:hypothetical protein
LLLQALDDCSLLADEVVQIVYAAIPEHRQFDGIRKKVALNLANAAVSAESSQAAERANTTVFAESSQAAESDKIIEDISEIEPDHQRSQRTDFVGNISADSNRANTSHEANVVHPKPNYLLLYLVFNELSPWSIKIGFSIQSPNETLARYNLICANPVLIKYPVADSICKALNIISKNDQIALGRALESFLLTVFESFYPGGHSLIYKVCITISTLNFNVLFMIAGGLPRKTNSTNIFAVLNGQQYFRIIKDSEWPCIDRMPELMRI